MKKLLMLVLAVISYTAIGQPVTPAVPLNPNTLRKGGAMIDNRDRFYAVGDNVVNIASGGNQAYTSHAVSTGQTKHKIWSSGYGLRFEWSTVWLNWSANPAYGDTNYNDVPFEMGAGFALVTTNTPDGTTKTNYGVVKFGNDYTVKVTQGVKILGDPIYIYYSTNDVLWVRTAISRVQSSGQTTKGGSYGKLANDTASFFLNVPVVVGGSSALNTGEGVTLTTYATWTNGTGANNGVSPFSNAAWIPWTWTTAITANSGNVFRPSAIYGYQGHNSIDALHSWVIKGTSILAGTGDQLNTVLSGGMGWGRRAIHGEAAYLHMAAGGEHVRYWVDQSGVQARADALKHAVSVLSDEGTNDLYSGDSVFDVEQALVLDWLEDKAFGATNIIQATFLPHGVTVASGPITNLTAQIQGTYYANITNVNGWLRQGAPITPGYVPTTNGAPGAYYANQIQHPLNYVFDTCAIGESSLNSGLWAVPGTNYITNLTVSSYTTSSGSFITLANGLATSSAGTSTPAASISFSGSPGFNTTNLGGYGDLTGKAIFDATQGTWAVILGNGASGVNVDRAMTGTTASDICYVFSIPTSDGTHPSSDMAAAIAAGFRSWYATTGASY